jgi:hypothetical protein
VYDGTAAGGFVPNATVEIPAIMGQTLSEIPPGVPDLWQRGVSFDVRLFNGALETLTEEEVFAGGNTLAVSSGSDWEILQFKDVEFLGEGIWRLSTLLRGRFGTEFLSASAHGAGASAILLDSAVTTLALGLEERDLPKLYRWGPAALPFDDEVFEEDTRVFAGVGLRPYAPVHLRAKWSAGSLSLIWTRRTRLAGDGWSAGDVALGEDREAYRIRLVKDDVEIASLEVTEAAATIDASEIPATPFDVIVDQISGLWGPGQATRITVDD